MNRFVCTSVIILISLAGCDSQEEAPIDYVNLGLDTPFTVEHVDAIAAIPSTSFGLDEIVLPNGRTAASFLDEYGLYYAENEHGESLRSFNYNLVGPQTQKNLIIGQIAQLAHLLTNRSNFVFEEEPPANGIQRPAQHGLAYLWGGKNHNTRRTPHHTGDCQDTSLHGLDCSGFIHQLVQNGAHIDFPEGRANDQRMAEIWQNAFAGAGLTKLNVEVFESLPPNQFESGDIIYWTGVGSNDAYHIGVVIENAAGELSAYSSIGLPDTPGCERNFGPTAGPQEVSLDNEYWFGGQAGTWGIVRIVTDISGDWTLFGRCQDQTTDAFGLDLTLTTDEEQVIMASGAGEDYDGSPLVVQMTGDFTLATNNMIGMIDFTFPNTGGRRTDIFEKELDLDDTGYFPAELVFHSTTGCDLAVRLANQEVATLPTGMTSARNDSGTGRISN